MKKHLDVGKTIRVKGTSETGSMCTRIHGKLWTIERIEKLETETGWGPKNTILLAIKSCSPYQNWKWVRLKNDPHLKITQVLF
jgi:hypothetical protein